MKSHDITISGRMSKKLEELGEAEQRDVPNILRRAVNLYMFIQAATHKHPEKCIAVINKDTGEVLSKLDLR